MPRCVYDVTYEKIILVLCFLAVERYEGCHCAITDVCFINLQNEALGIVLRLGEVCFLKIVK